MQKNISLEINEKPLSSNVAWQGRRFKSNAYKTFEELLLLTLPKKKKISGKVKITYCFYLKNHKMTDYDNLIKPLQDILVKKGYIDDDRKITEAHIYKYPAVKNKITIHIDSLD